MKKGCLFFFFPLFFSLLSLFCGTLLALEEPEPGKEAVTFSFTPTMEAEEVFLAGQFNNWRPNITPMVHKGGGVYHITLYLEPGAYQYKFVVNGVTWITPPQAHDYVPDGFGGQNGVIIVGLETGDERGIRGDGEINKELLYHNPDHHRYFNPLSSDLLSLRFMTGGEDVERVFLHLQSEEGESQESMAHFLTYNRFDYYRQVLAVSGDFSYYFQIQDGEKGIFYGSRGIAEDPEQVFPFHTSPTQWDPFVTPDWVKDAIFYQIFPDRFKNADPQNDPETIELYQDEKTRYPAFIPNWDQGVQAGEEGPITRKEQLLEEDNTIHPVAGYYVFYGGDLLGIEEEIPYLKGLNINAIYLNPIFKATAYHRYNTMGYTFIDDRLAIKGDQEASKEYFASLVKKLSEAGIRVILDGVFNHVGYEHWAFQDVVEKGPQSPYVDWFTIHSFPVIPLYQQSIQVAANYDCWWGFGHMPELNLKNPEVREYIFGAVKEWMQMGIHGWRLDVPIDVTATDPLFWRDFRDYVKELNPEAYLSGEIWGNAEEYLAGDAFDGVMNYRFRDAIYQFIGTGSLTPRGFHDEMMRLFLDYPEQAVYSLQNLVGSHDTVRYLTLLQGDKERARLTTLLKMTYFGAPMIYYGDEVAMEGGDDPDCRRTMIWEDRGYVQPDLEMQKHYQRLTHIRMQEVALRRGWIEYIPTNGELVYGFRRQYQENELLVFINASEEFVSLNIPIDLPCNNYLDIYQERAAFVRQGRLLHPLPPLEGAIIKIN